MAKQRIINTKFWSDSYIVELDPLERYLFIYLLTNEHTNISGIYEMALRIMSFETGIDKDMLQKMLLRLKEKIQYVNGWVCIKNFVKHQSANSIKVQQGISSELQNVPSEIVDILIGYGYPIHRSSKGIIYLNPNSNLNPNTNSNSKTEVETGFDQFWEKYPNKVSKSKAHEKWVKINPSPELFKKIIDSLEQHKKSNQWVKNNGDFIPHPATWLNQKRWEDEVKVNEQKSYVIEDK